MKKPLGELYSGGPERSLDAELEAKSEEITEETKKLRQCIEVGRERVAELYRILQQHIDDLNLIKERAEAMPLKMRLAAEDSGFDLEKTADEFSELQASSRIMEQQVKKTMETITGYEVKIKELETKLKKDSWRDPKIGQA